ncbi:MCE-family protein MCE4B [Mycobacterium tuberculosis]|nr:MCE-family protein MCE4B [Mycobacterium tuberculosis]
MAGSGVPSHRSMVIKVSVFAVVMLLVAAGLVVVFGDFRFGPTTVYHATFTDASRLKAGQKVRIAGVPVGSVKAVKLNPDHSIDVAFAIDRSYTLYSSTRAVIRYENLVGDRFLEITSGPGELRKLPPGGTINVAHTQPALDLDALLGGLRPVLKGFDADKINTITSAVIELLQGQGGPLANVLADTGAFSAALGARDQLIGEVITNLNAVLATVDAKSAQFWPVSTSCSSWSAAWPRTGIRSRAPFRRWRRRRRILRNCCGIRAGRCKASWKTPGRWLPSWTTERPRSTTTSSSSARTTCACPRWAVTEHSSTSTSAR